MQVKLISCWYNTSYAAYSNSLRKALARQLGNEVGVIASNCGCGDPMAGVFFDRTSDFFEFPNLDYWRDTNPVKRWIRTNGRQFLYRERAKRYLQRADGANVVHFQQTLNAYGSLAVFNWLQMRSAAARVITVHELDPYQQDFPQSNLQYNMADRIIVQANELRENLVALGVERDRIDLVEHGVDVPAESEESREGIMFYGGHNLNTSKGFDTLCQAMAIVKRELGAQTPVLKVYGYYGDRTRPYGRHCVEEAGIADLVRWLDRIDNETVAREYRKTLLCVLPFRGSFAGFAVANAMANGVPVIGTRCAGMPEHLGDTGTWIEPNDPQRLADAILRLLRDETLRRDIATRARARALAELSWDRIASKTLGSYQKALQNKAP